MELQPLSREHIDGIMEIENDSFSIPWSRGSMEKELENKLAIYIVAMAGYAGMSYYYSDRFFRGTTINGINCSGKTSEEAEQAVAKKAEDYLLEVKARNLKSLSFNFLPIKLE